MLGVRLACFPKLSLAIVQVGSPFRSRRRTFGMMEPTGSRRHSFSMRTAWVLKSMGPLIPAARVGGRNPGRWAPSAWPDAC
jgi:hypothetical protein